MVFNSYIFVLCFLPIVCGLYYIFIKTTRANIFLLFVSFTFYAYAGIECLILLILQIIFNYGIYKKIVSYKRQDKVFQRKIMLGLGILVNLGLLFYFKYYNFFIDISNLVFDTGLSIKEIIQPLGISFIVFQQIAFLIDVSRGEIFDCSFLEYSLFVSFFPHVSSGPIILHNDLLPDLRENKTVNWDYISTGIYIFVMGLGKKALIADTFAQAVDWGYANIGAMNKTTAVFVSFLYTLQIYFDFSGYSDMAIGVSRMLQLDLPINFNSPYKAKTILEFWDRWHITLTRFFTRYLYIPLGGSRKGIVRTYLNTMIVFLVSGIWHGASLTFIIWGAMHGIFMVFTKCFKRVFDKIPHWINQCITLLFVNFAWILFRAGSFTVFKEMMAVIVNGEWGMLHADVCSVFRPVLADKIAFIQLPDWCWAIGIVFVIILVVLKGKNVEEKAGEMKYSVSSCICLVFVAVLSILSFAGVSTFIYSLF